MKPLMIIALLFSSMSYAQDCVSPTKDPAINKLFDKTRYILGAAFDSQNVNYIDGMEYKNMADFRKRTALLKSDIDQLKQELKQMDVAEKLMLGAAVTEMSLCVSFIKSKIEWCSQALNTLKDYYWRTKLDGNDHAGHESFSEWTGFPDHLK